MIDRFNGEYSFLSNFYPSSVLVGSHVYPTVEHAFQSAKCKRKEDKEMIRLTSSPGEAKRLGQQVEMRTDWNAIRIRTMLSLLRKKFSTPELRDRLEATGVQMLIEGNNWGDRFWGQVDGDGENHLGELLMTVRTENRARRNH